MWHRIADYQSYCSCVADYVADNTKERWAELGAASERSLEGAAPEACGYSQQERLSREAGKERNMEYGSRGPQLNGGAWREVP